MMFPDGFDAFWALQFGSLITLREASRCLVACKGGAWGLNRFWAIWGEKSPEKKFPNVFGDTLGVYLLCFRMVLTHIGPSRPQLGSLIICVRPVGA